MAGLPPNLNNAVNANRAPATLPGLAAQVGAPENTQPNIHELTNDIKPERTLKRTVRNTFNISEMLLAIPLLANSFVLQADNISGQVEEVAKVADPGLTGYIANSFKTLSTVFRALVDKFVAGGNTADKIETNRSANLTQNFKKRFLHPNITKEFSALLFNTRRILFNLKPNFFTVPSAPHDPLNTDKKNHAGVFSANAYGFMGLISRPLTVISSLFAAATTIPSHLMGSYFTYTGNKNAYQATKYFNRLSEIFTPLLSNLSSLLSVSKSYIDSFINKESKFVARGRYNVGLPNVIQGLVGSITSFPYFLGIMGKFRDIVKEKDERQNYKFSENLQILAENVLPNIQPLIKKLSPNASVDNILFNLKSFVEKQMNSVEQLLSNFMIKIFNANAFTKKLASMIRPVDGLGNVQALADNYTVENNDSSDYAFGLLKKSTFFREIFDWLHPLQSMLMLLPNALVPTKDPYINDNSKRLGRRIDRFLGFNSMLLSAPNYLVYSASTRIPQLLLKYFEYKDRQHVLDIQKHGEGNATTKSGYQCYKEVIERVKKLPIIGTHFLAGKLESLNINEATFRNESEFREIFDDLDTSARKQESSVKASELVNAARIGFRTLLENKNKFFFAKRDRQTGLTDEEKTRQGFYESVGKFKNIVGKIPVVGWVAGPMIEAFRSFYKIDTTNRRNVIGLDPAAAAAKANQAATAALAA